MKVITPDFTKYYGFYEKDAIFNYKAGDSIFKQGESGDCMYVVLEGKVEVVVRQRQVSIMEKGDIFGDMSLIDNSPRSADIQAVTDCTLASVDKFSFDFLIGKVPGFALDMLRVMAVRIRTMNII